jgi:hypothetical protein
MRARCDTTFEIRKAHLAAVLLFLDATGLVVCVAVCYDKCGEAMSEVPSPVPRGSRLSGSMLPRL